MNTTLQIIYRFSILVPIGFCTSEVISMGVPASVKAPAIAETTAVGSPKDIFVPQPNNPPLFTRGSGTR